MRNSLGLCKHILVVLEHLHGRPGLLTRATKEQQRLAETAFTGPVWDPIRPLLGLGDWLERVAWMGGNGMKTRGTRAAQALAWFQPGRNGT
ncbi:MAG: hypothetical protein JO344_03465, partial [Planctomycetaceae bacterium]|nr:hypothetical protein [Planctomycetaceae bacterium]